MSLFLKLARYYHISVLASIIEDLKNKHPNLTNEIDLLAAKDPSHSHKYLRYAVKTLASGQVDINTIIQTINLFHQLFPKLSNKDINQWNFTELQNTLSKLNDLGETTSRTKSKQDFKAVKKEIATKGADILYQDDLCELLFVATKAEACFYGQNTDWCLTMENDRYFEDYQANNAVFYYLLRKNLPHTDPLSKVAISIIRDQNNKIFYRSEELTNIPAIRFFDKNDNQITPESAFHNLPSLLSLIKSDAESRPMPFMARAKFKPDSLSLTDFKEQFKDRRVREAVAEVTPDPIIQELLSHDKNTNTLAALAKNPYLTYDMFDKLSKIPNKLVAMELTDNLKTPADILKRLYDFLGAG